MLENLNDYDLVQACIQGNGDAFPELLTRYKNLVFSIIYRMVNDRELANDLAQEVFIKTYRNLDKYNPEYKFSTWIIRITTNIVIDYRRKKKLETTSIDDAPVEPISGETPENLFIKKEERAEVLNALNSLPDMYKIPMVLYHQQGLAYQDIADIIDEPLSKVKNRIFRARRMLKEKLSERGR